MKLNNKKKSNESKKKKNSRLVGIFNNKIKKYY